MLSPVRPYTLIISARVNMDWMCDWSAAASRCAVPSPALHWDQPGLRLASCSSSSISAISVRPLDTRTGLHHFSPEPMPGRRGERLAHRLLRTSVDKLR
jgi:hypothetical protein